MASNESVIKVYSRNGVYSRSLDWDINVDSLDYTLTAQRGCGGATLRVRRDADSGYILERDEYISVFLDDESDEAVYTGFISTRGRDRGGFNQTYEIRGFADYLAGISIAEDDPTKKVWFGPEDPEEPAGYIIAKIPDDSRNVETVREAVEWIYLNCVLPDYPDILWDEDLIDLTDVDVEQLEFDSAMNVFQVLEELSTIASVENLPVYFGVNPDKTLYFRQLTSADPQLLDVNYLNISFYREDFGEVYNILLLTTGQRDENNKKVRYRFQSDTSLLTYRPRRKALEKSWIKSAADAGRYAVGFFSKYSTPFESFTISQYFSDEPYDNSYRPWESWIKVTDGQSGEQRYTPFLEIEYKLSNVNSYTLSVARMEDDLEVGADGSVNDPTDTGDDTEETAVDPSDPEKLIVINPTTGLLTSEDGLVDDFTVVLTVAPAALVTVRLSGAVTTGVNRDREFTSTTWNTVQTVGMTDVNLDGTCELGVRLVAKPSKNIEVTYTADSGVSPSGATLTFTPENWDDVQTVTFTGIDSPDNPSFNVTLVLDTELFDSVNVVATTSNPGEGLIRHSGVGSYVESIDCDFGTGDFDDPQTIQIQGQDDDGTLEFGVSLNTQPTTNVVVSFTPGAGDPVDPITFTPENWATEQRVVMNGVEADVVFPDFNTYSFTMELDSGTVLPITVKLSLRSGVQDDLDIAPALTPEFATFTALSTPASFEVSHTQFHKKEQDVGYEITFTSTSDDPDYNDASIDTASVTNIDNDLKGVRVSPLENLTTAERGANKDQEFTIVLAGRPTDPVVITLHTYDSTSGQWTDPATGVVSASDKTLTFQVSDWNIPRTLVLVGQDDGIPTGEGDPDTRDYTVSITAVSDDPDYNDFGILPVEHQLTAGGDGITTIYTDGEDPTPVIVDDVPTTFEDTFATDEDDRVVASDRVVRDTMSRGIGTGTILSVVPRHQLANDGSSLDMLVLVFTGGNALTDLTDFTIDLNYTFVPSDGSDPTTGTLTKVAADAVVYSTGIVSFLFTSAGFTVPGYVYLNVISMAGDPLAAISTLPPDPPETLSFLVIDAAFTGDAAGIINPAALAKTTMITGHMPILGP